MSITYRFRAQVTDSVLLGTLDDGIHMENIFDGEMTEGALAGARVRGVDRVRLRPDGTAVLDIRETIEAELGALSADVRGYALPGPDGGALAIRGFALFRTSVPELAAYNSAVVAIEGSFDPASGLIDVAGHELTPWS